jgi:hypothetical protein
MTLGCFLFLSSLLLFFASRPCTNGIGMGLPIFGVSQVEVNIPRGLDPSKGGPECYRSVAGLLSSYEYVCGIHVSLFPFHSRH